MTAEPARLQLSRARGFDLQAHSRALNGLEAVNVARPTRWGNPFVWQPMVARIGKPAAIEASILAFRLMIEERCIAPPHLAGVDDYYRGEPFPSIGHISAALRGKNLACWCKPGEPCHADVLLELANA